MKKVIKIFLASSITEFATERNDLEVFIRNMSDIYEDQYDIKIKPVRCEQIDPYITDSRTQNIINQSLDECEMCVILVYTRFGEFSYEEFRHALKKFRESAEHLPKIYVYFKQLEDGMAADESVKTFMDELNNSLKHYYGTFKNIDTVKLRIALNFVAQKLDISNVALDAGKVVMNGVQMDDLDVQNVSEFFNSEELQRLRAELHQVEPEYYALYAQYKKGDLRPDSPEFQKYTDLAAKRSNLNAQIESLENEIFNLSVRMSKDEVSGMITERQKAAYRLFENGDLEGANEVLDEEEIENDYRARKAKIIARKMEELRQNAIVYISEIKTKIEILRTLQMSDENKQTIKRLYEKILVEAEENLVCLDVFYDYAKFVAGGNLYLWWGDDNREACLRKSLEIQLQLADIYKDNPEAASQEAVGRLCLLTGRTYVAMKMDREALPYLLRAEENLSALALRAPQKFNEPLCETFNVIGQIYKRQKDYLQAEKYFVKPTRFYLQSGRRMTEKVKKVLADNYRNMNVPQYNLKALELYRELYEQYGEAYSDAFARCCHCCAEEQGMAELAQKGIAIRKKHPDPDLTKHYFELAQEYELLAETHRINPWAESAEAEKAYLCAAEYYQKLIAMTDISEYNRLRHYDRIIKIYSRLCHGDSFHVGDPTENWSWGVVNDDKKRAHYHEIWKEWMIRKRKAQGSTDFITGVAHDRPTPTEQLGKELARRRREELEAQRIQEEEFHELEYNTVEEGVLAYAKAVCGKDRYFDRLRTLIEENEAALSTQTITRAAEILLDRLDDDRSMECLEYAVEIVERRACIDHGCLEAVNSVCNKVRIRCKDEQKKQVYSDEYMRFLEEMERDEKADKLLMEEYDWRISNAMGWTSKLVQERLEEVISKKLKVVQKYPDKIEYQCEAASTYRQWALCRVDQKRIEEAYAFLADAEQTLQPWFASESEDALSAYWSLAYVYGTYCDVCQRENQFEKAAEYAVKKFACFKKTFVGDYRARANAHTILRQYLSHKDIFMYLPAEQLRVLMRDCIDYGMFWYRPESDDPDDYVAGFDLAVSALTAANDFHYAREIAELMLEKMKALLPEQGKSALSYVKDALQKNINLSLALGDTVGAEYRQKELDEITA